jgi:hypothetical protein
MGGRKRNWLEAWQVEGRKLGTGLCREGGRFGRKKLSGRQ